MALSGTDASTAVDAARIFVALVALGLASVSDLRTRKVPNPLWYVTGAVGLLLLAVDLAMVEDASAWDLALVLPVAAVLAVTITGGELWPVMPPDEEDQDRELTPKEARVYIADLAVSAALLASSAAVLYIAPDHVADEEHYWYVLSSVLMILLALGLYIARVLHGGGDAKALMTLAVLFPIAPLGATFPLLYVPEVMELLFPFALAVLINAAIITALMPVAFLAISASRGPLRFPEALFGYPVPPDTVDDTRMWLLHEARGEDEGLERRLWPRRSKAAAEARTRALELMRARGEERVYVSPKLPFMVPMLAGLLLAIFLGNIITSVLAALMNL
jgi:preflagellin peptidase FlaK